MTAYYRYLLTLFLILNSGLIYCQSDKYVRPYSTHNLGPFVHSIGIASNSGGVLLQKKQFLFQNAFNIVNNASSAKVRDELVSFDGEMYRNEFLFSYGISNKWELSLKIPLVCHSSGFLDEFISNWHAIFNFPEKSRKIQPEYDINYSYYNNNNLLVKMEEEKLMLSDISLSLSHQILKNDRYQLALRMFYKQKMGGEEELIGSGTNDYGFHLNLSANPYFKRGSFSSYYSLGFMHIGKGALLDDWIGGRLVFGSLGLAFRMSEKVHAKSQIDFHSAVYRSSSTKQLGKSSMQISLGCDYFISNRFAMTFAFVEDLIVNTAPDFIFHFGTSYYF